MAGTFRKTVLAFFIATLTVSVCLAEDNKADDYRADDIKPQAEILHWWATAGESAALSVFIDEFKSRGGYYYDSSKYNEVANRKEAIERMGKGYPATLMQWNAGTNLTELYDFGLIKPIQSRNIVERLRGSLPAAVLDVVSHRNEIIAVPLNIHSENWMWYSRALVGDSDAIVSGNWDEFLDIGARLAEKDIPLLAVGNQSWQVRILFASVLLGVSRDRYEDFYIANNVGVVDTEGFRTALEVFSMLAQYSESFGDGNWNTQARAVANNRAAAHFMGDWARGEFSALGLQAGVDYGCQMTSSDGTSLLPVIDTLVLGKVEDESEIAGQELMLDVVSDAETSLRFNALKGSVSPYQRAAAANQDICTRQVHQALEDEDSILPPHHSYFPLGGDTIEQVGYAIYKLWNDSLQADQNADELVEKSLETFRSILERNRAAVIRSAALDD